MTHRTASVASMKDRAKRFSKIVRRVENATNEMHDNITMFFPILNGKVLDMDMAGAISRNARIDHVDGRLVVAKQNGRA